MPFVFEDGGTKSVTPSLVKMGGRRCVRVVVMGEKGVGKSALAVRFLTKRYIGEYQNTTGKYLLRAQQPNLYH